MKAIILFIYTTIIMITVFGCADNKKTAPQPKTSTLTFQKDILPILTTNCTSCHTNFDNYKDVTQQAERIAAAIKKPNPYMPAGREPLTDKEIADFNTWILNGKPNN